MQVRQLEIQLACFESFVFTSQRSERDLLSIREGKGPLCDTSKSFIQQLSNSFSTKETVEGTYSFRLHCAQCFTGNNGGNISYLAFN